MSPARRYTFGLFAAIAALVVASSETPRGFVTFGQAWANGTVMMQMQLTPAAGSLIDGGASLNQSAAEALNLWNQHTDVVRFTAVQDSLAARGDGDLVNNVFFDSNYYGKRFEGDTLAITTRWYIGAERVEADVVFNTAFHWDSYRGPLRSSGGRELWDIRRVALHEFGHALGLDHPDDAGQSVAAIMNSALGDHDELTADDIAGARSLYSSSVTSNVSFPPRNEPTDFFAQLIAVYRDVLGAAAVTTYVDPEGAVVWLSEYARYRVGLCGHDTATARVFSQIDNTGVDGVCAVTPTGAIPFPPRNEGLAFMNALDTKYRDDLRRGPLSSFVDNEDAVVWVMEYFRYRLNGCSHGDGTAKVLAQIRGQGVQPVCQ